MEVKINIPETWCDVKIHTFQEYIEVSRNSELEGYKKIIQQMSILTDTDEDIIYKLPYNYLFSIQKELNLLSTEPSTQFKSTIMVGDKKYGFQKNLHKLTLGEWIDLEHYVTKDPIQNLHYIAAILYRPIVKEGDDIFDYEICDYDMIQLENTANYIRYNMSIDDIYGIVVFFYLFVKELIEPILSSSKKKTMGKMKKLKTLQNKIKKRLKDPSVEMKLKQVIERSQSENGTGNSLFTPSQVEMLQNIIKS